MLSIVYTMLEYLTIHYGVTGGERVKLTKAALRGSAFFILSRIKSVA